jgi:hypothetical protein
MPFTTILKRGGNSLPFLQENSSVPLLPKAVTFPPAKPPKAVRGTWFTTGLWPVTLQSDTYYVGRMAVMVATGANTHQKSGPSKARHTGTDVCHGQLGMLCEGSF